VFVLKSAIPHKKGETLRLVQPRRGSVLKFFWLLKNKAVIIIELFWV